MQARNFEIRELLIRKLRSNYTKVLLEKSRIFFEEIMRFPKVLYWNILNLAYKLDLLSIYDTPIIINNFNRVSFLLQLIAFLEKCGFSRIIIIDNNSTYKPLLNYYQNCKHEVVRCTSNYGYLALWKSGLYDKYKWMYFVYTDSDLSPLEECPKNFIELFKEELDANSKLDKIGFGIKIDDLPDHFSLKEKVIKHETRFWLKKIKPNLYDAKIDTTFALYKPFSNLKNGESSFLAANRFGFPYLIRHLPWYVDSQNLTEEENYYYRTSNRSSSIGTQLKGEGNVY